MKRTTIYLDADLEIRLKIAAERRATTMADIIREALGSYLAADSAVATDPPGAGAFASGRKSTATRTEQALERLGFAED